MGKTNARPYQGTARGRHVGRYATCPIRQCAEWKLRNLSAVSPISPNTPTVRVQKEHPMTAINRSTPRVVSSQAPVSPPAARPAAAPDTVAQASEAALLARGPSRAEVSARRAANFAQEYQVAQRLTGSQQASAVNDPQRRITGWQALGIDPSSAHARYLVGGIAGEAGKGEEIAIGRAMVNRMDGYHDGKQSYRGGSMRDVLSRPGQFSTIKHHYRGSVEQAGATGGPRAAEKARVRALLNSTKTAAEWAALGANHKFEWFQSPGGGRYSRYSPGNAFNGGRTRFSPVW